MLNSDKCKLLRTNHSEDISINAGKEYIKSRASVKLLGEKIACKKARQQLHALARISEYMNRDKLRILCKNFIESQCGYCSFDMDVP